VQVLIVNPQLVWAQRIQARLRSTGARVAVADDWGSASAALDEAWPDILIIEHRILEKEAAALLAALREGDRLPIVVPTALGHLSTDPDEISLRGEDALRRLEVLVTRLQGVFESAARQTIRVGRLTVDPARKEVVFAARRVPLPPNQFRLLLYLALNTDRVVSQRELVREIWGYVGPESEARKLVKTHVRVIRRKLGWTDEDNNYLQSVRGFGYVLSPPQREPGKMKQEPQPDQPPRESEADKAAA
jgi:two-component system OmpR family response regulator